jgi:dihydroxyacetone kinase-like predicted kinase
MFAAATLWLELNADAINSINVYPVPDGDTGTNMYLTMRATMEQAFQAKGDSPLP